MEKNTSFKVAKRSIFMAKETIFVDESGNAEIKNKQYITNYPYFIFGFTFCNDPITLKTELYNLLTKVHRQKKYAPLLNELKFYPYNALKKLGYSEIEIKRDWEPHFDYVRSEAVDIITRRADGIFAGILDKRTIWKSTWTSERIGNYLFNKSLFENMLPKLNFVSPPEILYDKGRISKVQTLDFNRYMLGTDSYLSWNGTKKYNGNIISFKDADSKHNSGIWASDLVAGSFRHAYMKIDNSFLNTLKPKFIGDGSYRMWF